MILRKFAANHAQVFDRKTVDVVEMFFVKRRPQSAYIAYQILCTLADTRKDLMAKRRERYEKIIDDMDFSEEDRKKLQKFP